MSERKRETSKKEKERSALAEISIRNLGVIESANIEFKPGLTVLTGETGAGKTMVLTALGQVLGAKSDSDLVRTGTERSIVSASFSLTSNIASKLIENGDDLDGDSLVITRIVNSDGKSKVNIGGSLSTVSRAADIASEIIEIYGQATSARLSKSSIQRELLDLFSQNSEELNKYQMVFENYRSLENRIRDLRDQLKVADQEIASLKVFTEAFSKIMPRAGELTEIEQDINRLGSVEELNGTISSALNLLEDEDRSIHSALQQVKKNLDSLRNKDSALDQILDKYSEAIYDLNDSKGELITYVTRLEANPEKFDALQERKSQIAALIKKFGIGSDRDLALEEMINRYETSQERISDLTGGEERVFELERELSKVFKDLSEKAISLSEMRSKSASRLSQLVTAELSSLSMPNAQFICDVRRPDAPKASDFTPTGCDEVSFLFAGHRGAAPLALAKVASGGENSRVMLAIAVVLAENSPIGTYIFDEVDAGVGGSAAVEVGRRLKALSRSAQVIVITHLAQVAVWADQHLVVHKDESGSVSSSDVTELNQEDRKIEIARMLSGQSHSISAQEHATELLELVQKTALA